MAKLPKGYLEMGREDYAALDVETQRAVYRELRDIVRYTMGKDSADCAIGAHTEPVEWILAVKAVRCGCSRCRESGVYQWGACINGKMSHSARALVAPVRVGWILTICGAVGPMTIMPFAAQEGSENDEKGLCSDCSGNLGCARKRAM